MITALNSTNGRGPVQRLLAAIAACITHLSLSKGTCVKGDPLSVAVRRRKLATEIKTVEPGRDGHLRCTSTLSCWLLYCCLVKTVTQICLTFPVWCFCNFPQISEDRRKEMRWIGIRRLEWNRSISFVLVFPYHLLQLKPWAFLNQPRCRTPNSRCTPRICM